MRRPERLHAMKSGTFLMVAILVSAVSGGPTARQAFGQTWAEQLGYEPGKRVLILHIDQMGMCHETNQAGIDLVGGGTVQSAGVMAPCPWFGEFADWAQHNPSYDVGLTLTFNSEWKYYRWRPVSPRTLVPSLVDRDGFFWRSETQFAVNANPKDVELELRAQIDSALRAGIRPSHLNVHHAVLVMRPEFAEVYLRLAREYWIPAVMIELTPEHLQRFREVGLPLEDEMLKLLAGYPLPRIDELRFLRPASSYEQQRDEFIALVESARPGITQIKLFPAVESDALKQIARTWQQRVWSAKLLSDPMVTEALSADDIEFTNWKEIMRRFEGESLVERISREEE
jgi:predicted glycoside hydrolase/deacetylase ChbG (UPF0249 family)